jgi:hypothetical protein
LRLVDKPKKNIFLMKVVIVLIILSSVIAFDIIDEITRPVRDRSEEVEDCLSADSDSANSNDRPLLNTKRKKYWEREDRHKSIKRDDGHYMVSPPRTPVYMDEDVVEGINDLMIVKKLFRDEVEEDSILEEIVSKDGIVPIERNQKVFLTDLPPELLCKILEQLEFKDVLSVCQLNKDFARDAYRFIHPNPLIKGFTTLPSKFPWIRRILDSPGVMKQLDDAMAKVLLWFCVKNDLVYILQYLLIFKDIDVTFEEYKAFRIAAKHKATLAVQVLFNNVGSNQLEGAVRAYQSYGEVFDHSEGLEYVIKHPELSKCFHYDDSKLHELLLYKSFNVIQSYTRLLNKRME